MVLRSYIKVMSGLILAHLSWLGLFGSYINCGQLLEDTRTCHRDSPDWLPSVLLFGFAFIGRILYYASILIALALSL
jgi:hypothetical protein